MDNHLSMSSAYIGLGSNLDEPPRQLRSALEALNQQPGMRLCEQSGLYRSAPMGEPGQADYCNAVCRVETALPPLRLMQMLLAIERAAGRVRDGRKWGPRVLDLDLLHYEGVALQSESLTLPHPGLALRNFVLWPLLEIAPDLEIPGLGPVRELAQRAGRSGLQLL
jgi:2-amino-4-hydroxy-6-hydroxymethyldihydropteridine diphosphokinase